MKAEGHRRRRSPPGPLDVRIEQTVIGANFVDTDFRSGPYPVASLPAVLGFEGAGVVEAAGGEVTRLRPGSLAHANDPELYARGASDLLDALVDGMVAPIGARYALTDAARACGARDGEDNGKRDVDRVTRTMTTRDARARRASRVVRRAGSRISVPCALPARPTMPATRTTTHQDARRAAAAAAGSGVCIERRPGTGFRRRQTGPIAIPASNPVESRVLRASYNGHYLSFPS
ncbi:alcohol dehydrogenase catalytic domain-containing protein [Burkholderia sp. MSMB1498]|uniref:alcohol dehydrogenase catalytic domain-containing protein n=1 Tax=Burkholderia sp. MSMB1498 TaxID=1637842 RepID=UPI003FA4CCF5